MKKKTGNKMGKKKSSSWGNKGFIPAGKKSQTKTKPRNTRGAGGSR